MLVTLSFWAILQVLGVSSEGIAYVELGNLVNPRSPMPALVGDAVDVFNAKRAIEVRTAPAACTVVLSAIDFCSIASPGFLTYAPSNQAPCLCYSSSTWVPNLFDGYVASCVSYAKTADPTDYSALSELQGFCSSVGNVRPATLSASLTAVSPPPTTRSVVASPTITSKPAATSSTGIAVNAGCATISQLLNSCSSATQGFTDAPVKSQAACVCYSSSTWVPGSFDNNVQTCAEYVKTADPSDYSVISALGGFCSSVGDVLAASAVTVPTASAVVLTGGAASSTPASLAGNAAPAVTPTPSTAPPQVQTNPVTVTVGPAQTTPAKGAGAVNIKMWDNMLFGIAFVAVSAILFL